ncbi:MAG: hypothetical protein SAJ72_23845, partial [Jaaginema sp. PMC 1080.18]|nr:hypothetical protein [Jaaginema sp. PMC 1080.18]MEC4868894.1 hypothetical protein [Jaaginema sp. PMC 1078.18]
KVDVNVSKPEVNQELTGNQPQPQPLSKVDVNVSKPEVNQELTGNKPVFPATQRECAQYFNISPAALGKWVKNIEATGNSITTNSRRITSEGFELLCEYSQAGDRAYFLECLQPPQSQESNALAIRSESNLVSYGIDFDELFETVETDYNALDSSESATSQELAIYEAELVEFGQSYNTKEAQAHAILLRKEAEKAALLAKEVHQVKQAAYHQTLQRLEAKSTNFR